MSREACGHPSAALGLSVQARASTTEPQAGKGLLMTCQGTWEGLGTAGKARPGERQGESVFDVIH